MRNGDVVEAARSERSVDLQQEDLRKHLSRMPQPDLPPGAGAFDSGYSDTAMRTEEILRETGFGQGRMSDARDLAEDWQRRLAGKISRDSSDLLREDRER